MSRTTMLTKPHALILLISIAFLPLSSVKAQMYQQLSDRCDSLYNQGQIKEAFDLSKIAQKQAEREFGNTHAKYGLSLCVTGQFFQEFGEYGQAEKLMKEGVQIIEQSNSPGGEDYSFAISVLGSLYSTMNRLPEALPYIDKSVKLRERLYGKNSEEYAEIITISGTAHSQLGLYEKAISELQEVIAIRAKLYGRQHPRYAESVSNLGSIYLDIDDFLQAERYFEEALTVRETALGTNNIYTLYTLNNLASLKSLMGDHKQAITFSEEVLHKLTADYQKSDLRISSLLLLAGDLLQTQRYKQADSLCLIALPIIEENAGENNLRYSTVLHTQAMVCEATGRLLDAESLYQRAALIRQTSLGIENAEYVGPASDLAKLLVRQKKYEQADSIYAVLIPLSERVLGRSSIRYGQLLSDQLASYHAQQKIDKAVLLLAETNILYENTLTRQLPYWTPNQREKYITKYIPIYQRNISTATDLSKNANVPGVLYQQSLFLKNLLLNQQTSASSAIISSNNAAWLSSFNSIEALRNKIATQYTLPITQRKNLDSLEARAETLEKDLARQSAPFWQARQAFQTRWQDVRDALKPTEAAVEFVSFPYHNGRQQTDSVRYMALVLRPGDVTPQVVPLLTDEALLRRLLARKTGVSGSPALYATRGSELDTDQLTRGDSLYQLIWQPIDKLLGKAKTVYLSPSGLLHQVAFSALPYPAKKRTQYLADRYELRQVGSTRQLATPARIDDTYKTIVSATLYGGIQYDSVQAAIPTKRAGSWPFLPGTQREVAQIGQFIGPKATQKTGLSATETALKAQSGQSPSVLHVATHGFDFPDPAAAAPGDSGVVVPGGATFQKIANPLFRTGLLMAGANRVWAGGRPNLGEDDGILTAYEVASLNLSNTKLVVLSACETALGDIRGSEGVFGLQRAFKMAGVGYLLTSLWPVSDETTSDLMTLFYQNWKRHKTIRAAYQKTQQQMRQKYLPAVWAAFVLIE